MIYAIFIALSFIIFAVYHRPTSKIRKQTKKTTNSINDTPSTSRTNRNPFVLQYPQQFLDFHFDQRQKRKSDQYIGRHSNAGVIYSDEFIKRQLANTVSTKEPAAFTPYIEDYVIQVSRPPVHPFPRY
jgi:hypothetical protein